MTKQYRINQVVEVEDRRSRREKDYYTVDPYYIIKTPSGKTFEIPAGLFEALFSEVEENQSPNINVDDGGIDT